MGDADGGPLLSEREDAALVDLLRWLDRRGYRFVPPTPLTHARVTGGEAASSASVERRLFGWSHAIAPGIIPDDLQSIMVAAGILETEGSGVRSAVRVARLGGRLFLHSAHPTDAADAVFLGPDSYRFARLVHAELAGRDDRLIVDIGTGAGVGALAAANTMPAARVVGTDVNPKALRMARINARYAGIPLDLVQSDGLDPVDGRIDAAVANPPYLIDSGRRQYRDGGDMRGARVARDMACMAMARLSPGGRLVLYTGSPVVNGTHEFQAALADAAATWDCTLRFDELDPDVFGEELERPDYAGVERIALVAAVADRAR